ncbi:aminoglycoside phosphotransferase family protein [Vibrio fluvialis]|uniref:aminoglycoside phosphotransferase family protein n=1 Tax=Vibrio fluvialis TaxID=676 RepID=UPI001F1A31F5|nr:aminoglycoside phosphotransferase family protein [Vibrio fluvialis]MCE7597034.1 aminoglycoside phosphotransferase family protein [Vibrio fluvialis]UPO64954.1 capsular biosynthesis protein [Vibrio fluvialis]
MFLIMSGAYVGQELESEFGKLPPSFLPLGNRRLFQYQVALAPDNVNVYLSVPETFSLSSVDLAWLESKNVSVLYIPEGLNLGASLTAAINLSGEILDKPLHVLYGDTVFNNIPNGDDIITVSSARDNYNWAVISNNNKYLLENYISNSQEHTQKIIDGYFKFSNPRELIKCITQSEWNFINGVNKYHINIGLTAVDSDGWLDFGHVNTYYSSKAKFTTQRAFNELTITPMWIEKSSVKNDKIKAESNWFSTLPYSLRRHIPQYLGEKEINGKISYRLEYLYLTALNELFVFAKLSSQRWKQILEDCIDFLIECKEYNCNHDKTHSTNSLNTLFGEKTKQRLKEYCIDKDINLNDEWIYNDSDKISLKKIIEDTEGHLPLEGEISIIHGDFCFSNILYDFRSGNIKTIDPRGITHDGHMTLYGDIHYDIAKLSHSILGLYDWIIAGYYNVDINERVIKFSIPEEHSHKEIQQIFINIIEEKFGLKPHCLYAMQIQLFLSMLPLHSDDFARQEALFANVFRLHNKFTRLIQ